MFSPARGGRQVGRSVAAAERHARDFEALLAKVESGAAVDTSALAPEAPGELETLQAIAGHAHFRAAPTVRPHGLTTNLSRLYRNMGGRSEADTVSAFLYSAAPPGCEILAHTPFGRVAAGGRSALRPLAAPCGAVLAHDLQRGRERGSGPQGRERTARAAGALVRRTRNAPRMTARKRGRNTRTPGIRRNPPSVLQGSR